MNNRWTGTEADHCLVNHHCIRLCEKHEAISDMLGTTMCLSCLEYADEWK